MVRLSVALCIGLFCALWWLVSAFGGRPSCLVYPNEIPMCKPGGYVLERVL